MPFCHLKSVAVMAKTGVEVKGMLINKEYKSQDMNKDLGRMSGE